jgi:alcohol dehydrogenase
MPPVSFMGPGALQAAGAHVRGLGLRKALIVTDAPLVAAGAVAAVTAMLDAVGVAHAVYAGVEPNPTVGQVEAGLAVLREAGCDCVVSFGGGSPHDAAKGIAAVATSGGERKEGRGWGKWSARGGGEEGRGGAWA